jgi:predicted signal transduction protein with EAL and GGDEF domain
MNTTPSIDDLLEGLIVGLQNEIIPHLSNAKSVATAMMMQSLIQQVRQVLPMLDASVAHEHNEMTRTLREVASLLGERAASLGSRADVAIPADQTPVRAAHAQLGYGLQDTISDLDVLQRAGHATADAALHRVREFLMPTIMQNIAAISIGGGMIGRG